MLNLSISCRQATNFYTTAALALIATELQAAQNPQWSWTQGQKYLPVGNRALIPRLSRLQSSPCTYWATQSQLMNKTKLANNFFQSVPVLINKSVHNSTHTNKQCISIGINEANLLSGKPVYHLTLRLLMSYIYIYIYAAPILDVSRSHTTTHQSR